MLYQQSKFVLGEAKLIVTSRVEWNKVQQNNRIEWWMIQNSNGFFFCIFLIQLLIPKIQIQFGVAQYICCFTKFQNTGMRYATSFQSRPKGNFIQKLRVLLPIRRNQSTKHNFRLFWECLSSHSLGYWALPGRPCGCTWLRTNQRITWCHRLPSPSAWFHCAWTSCGYE